MVAPWLDGIRLSIEDYAFRTSVKNVRLHTDEGSLPWIGVTKQLQTSAIHMRRLATMQSRKLMGRHSRERMKSGFDRGS